MSAVTLYQMVGQFREASTTLIEMDLPDDVVNDTLSALTGDIEVKSAGVACVVLNMEAMAEAIETASKQMKLRAERIRKRSASLREYLKINMEAAGVTKIEAVEFVLTIKKNPPAVIIDDETKVPPKFMVTPPPPPPPAARPDKKLIAAAFKAGETVEGCRSESGTRLEIKQ